VSSGDLLVPPIGVVGASVTPFTLPVITQPLSFERAYQRSRVRTTQLSGLVTVSFPTEPLDAPDDFEQYARFVLVFCRPTDALEGVRFPYEDSSWVASGVVSFENPDASAEMQLELPSALQVMAIRAAFDVT